eukprot:gene17706-biopygen8963
MGDEERSARAQAKGWSGEGQRRVAAVAKKRSDGCDEADDGSDGAQDAMTDEDARTRLFRGRRRRQRKPYTERPPPPFSASRRGRGREHIPPLQERRWHRGRARRAGAGEEIRRGRALHAGGIAGEVGIS